MGCIRTCPWHFKENTSNPSLLTLFRLGKSALEMRFTNLIPSSMGIRKLCKVSGDANACPPVTPERRDCDQFIKQTIPAFNLLDALN